MRSIRTQLLFRLQCMAAEISHDANEQRDEGVVKKACQLKIAVPFALRLVRKIQHFGHGRMSIEIRMRHIVQQGHALTRGGFDALGHSKRMKFQHGCAGMMLGVVQHHLQGAA